ncbi:Putative biotin ligase [uncultured archaeon]|nr:Putative biotin ligase [uncultured archaeon]
MRSLTVQKGVHGMDVERFRSCPRANGIFFKIHAKGVAGSTNEDLKALAESGAPEGTVIAASMQTRGKGRTSHVDRLPRKWESPAGGLYFSLLLKPQGLDYRRMLLMPMLAGVAVAEGIENAANIPTQIRWVNDILAEDRKLCGILVEASMTSKGCNYMIVGAGVNANFPASILSQEIAPTATTISDLTSQSIDLNGLLASILERISHHYNAIRICGPGETLKKMRIKDWSAGRPLEVAVYHKGVHQKRYGIGAGIDDSGMLLLDEGPWTTRISCGEIFTGTAFEGYDPRR